MPILIISLLIVTYFIVHIGYENAIPEKIKRKRIAEIGLFMIGETRFQIPRKYIWFSRNIPDGELLAVNLMFTIPNFEAGNVYRNRSNNVNTLIKSLKNKYYCYDSHDPAICYTTIQVKYHLEALGGNRVPDSYIVAPDFQEDIRLYSFVPDKLGAPVEVFYDGDILRPTYWLICKFSKGEYGEKSIVNPSCHSEFYLTDRLKVSYSFNKKHLSKHLEIRGELINKIDAFMSANRL